VNSAGRRDQSGTVEVESGDLTGGRIRDSGPTGRALSSASPDLASGSVTVPDTAWMGPVGNTPAGGASWTTTNKGLPAT